MGACKSKENFDTFINSAGKVTSRGDITRRDGASVTVCGISSTTSGRYKVERETRRRQNLMSVSRRNHSHLGEPSRTRTYQLRATPTVFARHRAGGLSRKVTQCPKRTPTQTTKPKIAFDHRPDSGPFFDDGLPGEKQLRRRLKRCQTIAIKTNEGGGLNLFSREKFVRLQELDNEALFWERFQKLTLAGVGRQGTVFLVRSMSDRVVYAVKQLRLGTGGVTRDSIFKEIEIHCALDHPNLLKIFEVYMAPNGAFLVMQCIHNSQDLLDEITNQPLGHLDVRVAMRHFHGIMSALHHMHIQNYIHCDVKPENVMCNPKITKLIDYGEALPLAEAVRTCGPRGTVHYMAPEVSMGAELSPASDVFSAGITLYVMLLGVFPWDSDNEDHILVLLQSYEGIDVFKDTKELLERLDPDLRDLLLSMLEADPVDRPTTGEILRHTCMVSVIGRYRTTYDGSNYARRIARNLLCFPSLPPIMQKLLIFVTYRYLTPEQEADMAVAYTILSASDNEKQSLRGIVKALHDDDQDERSCTASRIYERLLSLEDFKTTKASLSDQTVSFTHFATITRDPRDYVTGERIREFFDFATSAYSKGEPGGPRIDKHVYKALFMQSELQEMGKRDGPKRMKSYSLQELEKAVWKFLAIEDDLRPRVQNLEDDLRPRVQNLNPNSGSQNMSIHNSLLLSST